jgi:hypothetical protein
MTLWAILTITTSAAAVFRAAPFLRRLDQPNEVKAADRVRSPSSARFSPDQRDFAAVAIGGVIVLGSVGLYALNGGGDLRARQPLGQAEGAGQALRLALEAFKDAPQKQERIYSAARELELMK